MNRRSISRAPGRRRMDLVESHGLRAGHEPDSRTHLEPTTRPMVLLAIRRRSNAHTQDQLGVGSPETACSGEGARSGYEQLADIRDRQLHQRPAHGSGMVYYDCRRRNRHTVRQCAHCRHGQPRTAEERANLLQKLPYGSIPCACRRHDWQRRPQPASSAGYQQLGHDSDQESPGH